MALDTVRGLVDYRPQRAEVKKEVPTTSDRLLRPLCYALTPAARGRHQFQTREAPCLVAGAAGLRHCVSF